MKVRKECWCGCDSFLIMQEEDKPKRIIVKCKMCKAERRVCTPEQSVPVYAFIPEFPMDSTDKEKS